MGRKATTRDNTRRAGTRSASGSKRFLLGCLGVYLALGGTYATVFPLGHAPDEPAHFAYVLFIAEHGRLPDFYADRVGYESYQAPLYYTLSAVVCKLTMLAADRVGAPPEPAMPRWLAAAAEPDAPLPPQITKHPWVPSFQYRLMFSAWEQALALTPVQRAGWLAVRLFTVLLGGLGVFLGWRITDLVFPESPWLANAVAASMAFLPMYDHISAAVGNDPATVVAVGLSVLLILLVLRDGPQPRRVALLGVALGLGMLTKDSADVTIPVAIIAIIWAAGRRFEPAPAASYLTDLGRRLMALRWGLIVKRVGLMLGVCAAVAGWWFIRNAMHYGHAVYYPANPQTQLPWDYYFMFPGHIWLALGLSLPMIFRNFWGNFAWTNVALPTWIYWGLLVVSLLPLPGLEMVLTDARAGRLDWSETGRRGFRAIMITLALMILAVMGHALFIGIGGGSQGRYLFPVLFALAMLWMLGVNRELPERWRSTLPWLVGAAMLAFNLYCLFGVILPFYRALGV